MVPRWFTRLLETNQTWRGKLQSTTDGHVHFAEIWRQRTKRTVVEHFFSARLQTSPRQKARMHYYCKNEGIMTWLPWALKRRVSFKIVWRTLWSSIRKCWRLAQQAATKTILMKRSRYDSLKRRHRPMRDWRTYTGQLLRKLIFLIKSQGRLSFHNAFRMWHAATASQRHNNVRSRPGNSSNISWMPIGTNVQCWRSVASFASSLRHEDTVATFLAYVRSPLSLFLSCGKYLLSLIVR